MMNRLIAILLIFTYLIFTVDGIIQYHFQEGSIQESLFPGNQESLGVQNTTAFRISADYDCDSIFPDPSQDRHVSLLGTALQQDDPSLYTYHPATSDRHLYKLPIYIINKVLII